MEISRELCEEPRLIAHERLSSPPNNLKDDWVLRNRQQLQYSLDILNHELKLDCWLVLKDHHHLANRKEDPIKNAQGLGRHPKVQLAWKTTCTNTGLTLWSPKHKIYFIQLAPIMCLEVTWKITKSWRLFQMLRVQHLTYRRQIQEIQKNILNI